MNLFPSVKSPKLAMLIAQCSNASLLFCQCVIPSRAEPILSEARAELREETFSNWHGQILEHSVWQNWSQKSAISAANFMKWPKILHAGKKISHLRCKWPNWELFCGTMCTEPLFFCLLTDFQFFSLKAVGKDVPCRASRARAQARTRAYQKLQLLVCGPIFKILFSPQSCWKGELIFYISFLL